MSPVLREKLEAEARRRGLVFAMSAREDYQPHQFTLSDLKIRTEESEMVSLTPNDVQAEYLDIIAPQWRSGDFRMSGTREIILKARKQGFSTLILGLVFLDTINRKNIYTVVMAHDYDSTVNLFEIVQGFYNHLPESTRPRTRYANRREYTWPDLGSRFFVGTAGSDDFGRGSTVNNVHGSEIASWRDGDKVASGLLQAVPKGGNIWLESTAQGKGNFYHDEYWRAKDGESAYRNHFVAWFESPKYSTPVRAGFVPTPDELQLQKLYNLTLDQLQWRRDKMSEPGMRKKFSQEFPANEREAFISSGNPYFDLAKLDELEIQLKDVCFNPLPIEVPDGYSNLCQHRDFFEIWEMPKENGTYVIGADVAEGIEKKGKDHDYSSLSVWDAETEVQVAHFHTRIHPHTFGLICAEIGFWYNTALLGIERNNHGHAAISAALFTANYPEAAADNSSGLYMHQEYDEKREPTERRAGYPTDKKSKYFILDELAETIQSGNFHPRSRKLVSDLGRFVHLPGNKAGAETGHDDRVMDAAIARRMLNLRPRRKQVIEDIIF